MNINVRLNAKSIESAIKKIEAYQKRIDRLIPNFLTACAEKVRDLANANISAYEYDTEIIAEITSLASWVIETTQDGVVTLRNTSEKATYIEFGVGQIGEGTHTEAQKAGYQYDINSHGAKGWGFYVGEGESLDLRQPYYNETYKGDKFWVWTKGEPATMFAFNALMEFREKELYKGIWNDLVKDL